MEAISDKSSPLPVLAVFRVSGHDVFDEVPKDAKLWLY